MNMDKNKPGFLHTPEHLMSLAKQLRSEADRAEARAERLTNGSEEPECKPGCWNIQSTCIKIQPL